MRVVLEDSGDRNKLSDVNLLNAHCGAYAFMSRRWTNVSILELKIAIGTVFCALSRGNNASF